ncbi:hypothetical protein TYRP_023212 [Tyrophagus putrescentiae]|nr:hypothetical protein TYRP_023212 [Tyrophagus putrescentiae]
MANFDEQQNDDLPFWPTSEKTVFHPSNDMIVAKATFYVEKAKFARLVPVDKEPPNRFAITFAANIITLIKGLRMFAIKEPTPDDSDDEDHNVSPLYDCIINPTKFQTNIYTADQSLDDKVIALVNCPNTAVLIEDGGPGTGKTTLATKAIAHAMQEQEKEKEGASMRVLMCASSNSAADILFNKMTAIFPSKYIYRVGENTRISDVVKSRMDDEKSEILKKLKKREEKNRDRFQEKYGEEASEILAKKYFLQKAQIIVSTLGSAQTTELVNNRAKLNFTLLFIDEAGQSKVDEILLPLHFNSLSKLFIIGDPRQLGPIYKSHLLQQYSPSITSTFTRLCFLLADKPGVVHRLRLQFRMHDSVARIVNSISYRNDDQLTTSLDGNWRKVANHLPFAVFTSRDWTDEVSGGSFSRHSEKEAEFGMQLLKASLILAGFNFETNCFKPGYEPLQYAIIPLYKSQVKLYRNLVKRENLQHVVNVATVDQMQGSEVNIAIVSAVRASEDINGSVGFASDIRRLNVALSRAGAVYVLAKAHTFRSTPGWTKIFIAAVKENLLFQFDGDFDGRRLDQFLSRNMQENILLMQMYLASILMWPCARSYAKLDKLCACDAKRYILAFTFVNAKLSLEMGVTMTLSSANGMYFSSSMYD